MFMSFVRPEVRTFASPLTPSVAPAPKPQPTARAEHAHLLSIAAARRLRAIERLREARLDDAEYWIACAPVAVTKAAGLRGGFAPLP
jgi:hypothetical protein